MSDDHILRMTEQIGELNGTVKALTDTVREHIEQNSIMHKDHYEIGKKNTVDIEKINSRHSTYWKIIGSMGGLGTVGAFLAKFGGGGH